MVEIASITILYSESQFRPGRNRCAESIRSSEQAPCSPRNCRCNFNGNDTKSLSGTCTMMNDSEAPLDATAAVGGGFPTLNVRRFFSLPFPVDCFSVYIGGNCSSQPASHVRNGETSVGAPSLSKEIHSPLRSSRDLRDGDVFFPAAAIKVSVYVRRLPPAGAITPATYIFTRYISTPTR